MWERTLGIPARAGVGWGGAGEWALRGPPLALPPGEAQHTVQAMIRKCGGGSEERGDISVLQPGDRSTDTAHWGLGGLPVCLGGERCWGWAGLPWHQLGQRCQGRLETQ